MAGAVIAVLLAAGAAVMYAIASVLQHGAAGAVPGHVGTFALIGRLIRSPRWLLGRAAGLAALGLLALALAHGTLTVVQAVAACGLLVALGIEAATTRRASHRFAVTAGHGRARTWIGALVVVAGVIALVAVGRPGGATGSPSMPRWLIVSGVVGTAAVAALTLARGDRTSRRRHGAIVAVLAGIGGAIFAFASALLKQTTTTLEHHGALLHVVAWASGFGLVAIVGNLLLQRAFHQAPLASSLPILTAAEPVAGLVYGTILFREHLHPGALSRVFGIGGIALLAIGIVLTATPKQRLMPPPAQA
jgi:drug/metabolite transporter (DMT)-like permease